MLSQFMQPVSIYYHLAEEGDRLFAVFRNTLHVIDPLRAHEAHRGAIFRRIHTSQLQVINAFAYNPLNYTLILSDSKAIFEYKVETGDIHVLKVEDGSKVLSLGMDEISGNIYWTDDTKSVNIMSLTSRRQLGLLRNLDNICDMLIVSQRG